MYLGGIAHMNKEFVLDLINAVRNDKKKANPLFIALAVIGAIAAAALIGYAVYRFLTPDYFDDYDDDDDFDDDDFEDDFDDFEDDEAEAATV